MDFSISCPGKKEFLEKRKDAEQHEKKALATNDHRWEEFFCWFHYWIDSCFSGIPSTLIYLFILDVDRTEKAAYTVAQREVANIQHTHTVC